MNVIDVTGCLVSAPDVNSKRANFTLVDNTFYNHPQFINCVAFKEDLIKKFKDWGKGFLVQVVGRLEIKKFKETKYTSIIIDRITLLRKPVSYCEDNDITGGVFPSPPELDLSEDLDFEDVPF